MFKVDIGLSVVNLQDTYLKSLRTYLWLLIYLRFLNTSILHGCAAHVYL